MNKVVLAVLFAGFGAQLIKLIQYWFKHKTLNWKDIIVTGGMPSSHAAFVISLATIIFLTEGASTIFAVSLVLAFIVIRDSFGVRRSVGEDGVLINSIIAKLKLKKRAHVAMGHTPLQVFVGSLIGIISAVAVYFL